MDSSAEWFDVVDGSDRVVGRAPRGEVHRRRLLHRAVHVILLRPDGALFLQKRSEKKDTAPGRWVSSCSGHVDAGEDYAEAARREIAEEIGVDAGTVEWKEIGRVEAAPETGQEFVRLFAVRGHEGPLCLNPEEIADGAWFRPDEIDAWMARSPDDFAPSFRYLWPYFRAEASANGL